VNSPKIFQCFPSIIAHLHRSVLHVWLWYQSVRLIAGLYNLMSREKQFAEKQIIPIGSDEMQVCDLRRLCIAYYIRDFYK
jgi:hypothetical protein